MKKQQLMIHKVICSLFCVVATLFSLRAANVYYVDANHGDDSWDGSTAVIPTEEQKRLPEIPGPRKTLAEAARLLTAKAGDTLCLAEGVYDDGVMERPNTGSTKGKVPVLKYRVVLPEGTYMRAAGRRSETVIKGEKGDGVNGIGPNAIRCVYAMNCYIKGLTIQDGHAQYSAAGTYEEATLGGGVHGGNLLDCTICDCSAGYGGGTYGATTVRCRYSGCTAANSGPADYSSSHCNTLFECAPYFSDLYYCTISQTVYRPNQNGSFYGCCLPVEVAYGTHLYSNTVYSADHGNVDQTCRKANAAEIDIDENLIPRIGSPVVDFGNAAYYESVYPQDSFFAEDKYKDYLGNLRIVGREIDSGAIEAPSRLMVADPNGYLLIEGVEPGVVTDIVGECVLTVRIKRIDPRCIGLKIGDEIVADFTAHSVSWAWEQSFSSASGETRIEAVYTTSVERHWYVDAVNGKDDDHPGTFPDVGWAKKTLEKVMGLANKGDVVHAAPGVYDKGGMYDGATGSNRVIVADGVLLVADEGPYVTAIEGKISTESGNVNGCGNDSMRAVLLGSGSVIKGFTITKGRPDIKLSNSNNGNGAGVYHGLAVECVFSNNVASYRGNAACGANLLRCFIGADPAGSYCFYSGTKLVDCVVASDKDGYSYNSAYNSTFLSRMMWGNSEVRNCLFLGTSPHSVTMYDCICCNAKGSGAVDMDESNRFEVPIELLPYDGKTLRPRKGSVAIDSGVDYYSMATNGWPSLWQSFIGFDYASGQRVYNARIDVGAGEYDWRNDFAKKLAQRNVEVSDMSPEVTTNAVVGLDVANAQALKLEVLVLIEGMVSFSVAVEGDGVATVHHGDELLMPGKGGTYTFSGQLGLNSMTIAYSGKGKAVVSGFALTRRGIVILVK